MTGFSREDRLAHAAPAAPAVPHHTHTPEQEAENAEQVARDDRIREVLCESIDAEAIIRNANGLAFSDDAEELQVIRLVVRELTDPDSEVMLHAVMNASEDVYVR